MSRIDEELAQAVAESEEAAPAVATATPAVPAARQPASKRNLGLLVALFVMGGGILALVLMDGSKASSYAKDVDQVVAEKAKLGGRNVRVTGTLTKGTLIRKDEPCESRFQIEKNGATLPVTYSQCVVPDNFRDVPGMDVVVIAEGKLAQNGRFEASKIMAQCPSKYEMKQRQANGEQMPHQMPPAAIN